MIVICNAAKTVPIAFALGKVVMMYKQFIIESISSVGGCYNPSIDTSILKGYKKFISWDADSFDQFKKAVDETLEYCNYLKHNGNGLNFNLRDIEIVRKRHDFGNLARTVIVFR